MIVRLQTPKAKDDLYLINSVLFMKIVCPEDLALRDSLEIKDSFHVHWFQQKNNELYFHAPEFYLTKGIARFINGRHRTLLLAKHLREFPMALTNMDGFPVFADYPSLESCEALEKFSINKLNGSESFSFPDLPIEYLGFDYNILK